MAVDTFGHLLALHVTPANHDNRAEVERLAEAIQIATDQSVELAYVDQLHGQSTRDRRKGSRDRAGGGQAARSQARVRAATRQVDRQAILCLGYTMPTPCQRL